MPIIAVARQGLENNYDQGAQYDIDPSVFPRFNAIGSWGLFVNQPDYYGAGYFGNGRGGPAAPGDGVSFRFAMMAGTYTMRAWLPKAPDCGILAITMNGFSLANVDLYDLSLLYDFTVDIPQIAVADGVQELRFAITGKNVASSDYLCRMQYFNLAPWMEGVL